jgi:hypothetical protein
MICEDASHIQGLYPNLQREQLPTFAIPREPPTSQVKVDGNEGENIAMQPPGWQQLRKLRS